MIRPRDEITNHEGRDVEETTFFLPSTSTLIRSQNMSTTSSKQVVVILGAGVGRYDRTLASMLIVEVALIKPPSSRTSYSL